MNKKLTCGILITLLLVTTFISVEAFPFKTFKKAKTSFFDRVFIPRLKEPTRDVMSISNPAKYNEVDLLRFAEQGIDIHNWATWYGGKNTPYRNPDGTFYLSETQKQLIRDLYSKGERIFWIGVTTDHITFIFEDPYTDTANAIKAYTDFFKQAGLWKAKVGIYIPIWQDEIITRHREGMTWQEQYDLAETSRTEIKNRLTLIEWRRIKWTITGQDFMEHDGIEYQLTNNYRSYWAHHSAVTQPWEAEDLVYHHVLSIMADEDWKAIWKKWGKFAWTDGSLVEGEKGSRELTELGKNIFN